MKTMRKSYVVTRSTPQHGPTLTLDKRSLGCSTNAHWAAGTGGSERNQNNLRTREKEKVTKSSKTTAARATTTAATTAVTGSGLFSLLANKHTHTHSPGAAFSDDSDDRPGCAGDDGGGGGGGGDSSGRFFPTGQWRR
ncbi:hypothetical protein V1264_025102 [Littorina saxatilis]|uniref:Uncharacterized protein n=1 Tax=Littorina saxatilis TaxID=31220 RepID=A0AAN9AMG8_9CAEN